MEPVIGWWLSAFSHPCSYTRLPPLQCLGFIVPSVLGPRTNGGWQTRTRALLSLGGSLGGQQPSRQPLRQPLQAAAHLLEGHGRTSAQTHQVSPSGQHFHQRAGHCRRGTGRGAAPRGCFCLVGLGCLHRQRLRPRVNSFFLVLNSPETSSVGS